MICPERGASYSVDRTCMDDFHQMLGREAEIPGNGEVHHLAVLCFFLLHPALYSMGGLREAKKLLALLLERGVSPREVRKQNHGTLSSSNRTWKITSSTKSQGSYDHPPAWARTAQDVVAGGSENYCANVRAWAQSVLDALRASRNI